MAADFGTPLHCVCLCSTREPYGEGQHTMPLQKTRPTTEERLVTARELFFSTTDRRGVIRSGNSVFSRIAQIPLEELLGSPHNIIRHPDMPAAAFKVMWDRLLAGKPMAAYVKNLARDGSFYWVFATITPLHDGFLSVRMSPASPLFDAAQALYKDILALERVAQDAGMSRPAAAVRGVEEVERRLQELGFAGYEELMLEALPAEVAARSSLVSVAFARPNATGPLAEILDSSTALDRHLEGLVGQLNAYRELSAALAAASTSMLTAARQLNAAVASARSGSATVAADAPVLRTIAEAMVTPSSDTVRALETLVEDLAELRPLIAGLRFRIALARLHNDMVAAFACEVLDDQAPPNALAEVPLLCDALQEGVLDMAETMERVNLKLAATTDLIGDASELLNDFRRFLGKWRILVMRRGKTVELGPYIDPIDQQLADGHDQLQQLLDLGHHCRSQIVPFDQHTFEALLGRIRNVFSNR